MPGVIDNRQMTDATDPRYPIGRFAPPSTYTAENRTAALAAIAALPGALRAALHGLGVAERQTPYREGGWTVAQVVHHLADSHMNAYVRLKLVMTEPQPTIKPYKEGEWAKLPDATDPDLTSSLALIEALHARWSAFLSRFSADDFTKSMVHPERGVISVDWTVALYAWHGRHHVAHITSLRARNGW